MNGYLNQQFKTVVAVAQAKESLEHGLTTVGEISRSGIHIRNMVEKGVDEGAKVITTGLGFVELQDMEIPHDCL